MGELFDRYVAVDWSAANAPKTGADSIWVAVVDGADPELHNPPTRAAAAQLLIALHDRERRTLVAIDAALGYPRGSATALGLTGAPAWRAWWDRIAAASCDDEANRNNRFEVAGELNRSIRGDGPFWGCHAKRRVDGLTTTKPAEFAVPEFRHAETWLRARGLRPASCWQLLGAGSVGSQTLTLLPILHRWFAAGRVDVWPFTTGLDTPRVEAGRAVVVETWPTGFGFDLPAHWIRDAAQVHEIALALRAADDAGELGEWFAPALPSAVRSVVEAEEGWVLLPPPS